MGRYYFDAKTTVEQATQLSIFKLKQFGLLRGYCASTLTWTHKASGKQNSIGITVDIEDEPYVNACRLLKNAKVRANLQKLRDAATEKTLIDGVKIINEYAKLAFTDISDYIDIDKKGNLIFRPFKTIDKDKFAAIESIKKRSKTTTNKDGTEHTTTTKEIKLHSKLSALDSLGKHFGVFEKDNSLKQTKPCVIVNFADIPIED